MGMGMGMNMATNMGMAMSANENMYNNANNMPQMMMGGFSQPQLNTNIPAAIPVLAEDNAYFRQPVNPHRHQARQRRVRPSDYREV